MSPKRLLQTPGLITVLAIVAIVLAAGLISDVVLGVVVVVPFLLCVWWVRNHHLTLLREAVESSAPKRKLSIVQDKES